MENINLEFTPSELDEIIFSLIHFFANVEPNEIETSYSQLTLAGKILSTANEQMIISDAIDCLASVFSNMDDADNAVKIAQGIINRKN